MRRLILQIGILLTVFLLTSCRPKGVLSTEKMTDLLFDIHLVESMSDTTYGEFPSDWTQGLSRVDFTDLAYQSVLRKHAVTEEDFYQSVAYYSKRMRLFTRIYTDVDKKLEAYIQSIDTWTENKKTEQGVKKMMLKDDAHIRAMFEYMHIKPNAISYKAISFRPDSIKARNIRYIERLFRKPTAISTTHSMMELLTAAVTQKHATDSIEGAVGDSTTKSGLPSVNVLLHEALPIKELLRLQAAGAYDALTPKKDQQVNQQERAKMLKERASNQR